MRRLSPQLPCCLLLILSALLGACRDPVVTTYRTAKEASTETTPPVLAAATAPATSGTDATMANTAVATATGAGLTWTAPAHWVAKPASAMRKATFTLTGHDGTTADLAITAFPGDVGGELANLNRWRGQLSLPPITDAEVVSAITRYQYNSLRIAVVDFAGPGANPPTRMLGAIVPVGSATWFFKLTGPDALVAAEKPAFLAFLQTVKAP